MIRASETSRPSTVKSLRSTGRSLALADRGQVVGRPAEELAVGEDREAAAPRRLVGGGQRGGVEVGGQVALRRRAALDLGDHRRAAGGRLRRRRQGGRNGRGSGASTAEVMAWSSQRGSSLEALRLAVMMRSRAVVIGSAAGVISVRWYPPPSGG